MKIILKHINRAISFLLVLISFVPVMQFCNIKANAGTVAKNDFSSVLRFVQSETNELYYQRINKLVYGGNVSHLASTGEKSGYKDMYVGQSFTHACPGNGLYLKNTSTNKIYCTGGWQCFAYAKYAFYNIFGTLDGKKLYQKLILALIANLRMQFLLMLNQAVF